MNQLDNEGMKWSLFILGIILFVWAGVLASMGNAPGGTLILIMGTICLLFSFLSRFKRLKVWKVLEAELWEDKMEEAEKVISGLRKVSVPISKLLIALMTRLGKYGGALTKHEQYDQIKKIEEMLISIEGPKEDIEEIKKDWEKRQIFDFSLKIFERIREFCKRKKEQLSNNISALPSPLDAGTSEFDENAQLANQLQRWGEVESYILNEKNKIEEPEIMVNKIETIFSTIKEIDQEEEQRLRRDLSEDMEDLNYFFRERKFRPVS